MQRKIEFSVGEFYHVYNRGVDKRNIFLDDGDNERFLRLLYITNSSLPVVYKEVKNKKLIDIDVGERIVAIGAYALMRNHIHLLVKEIRENGLSLCMEKLTTAYAKYFNKKYDRVGTLFQGRFKAEHVDRDEYLKYLYSYIHLNPIKMIDTGWKSGGIRNAKRAEQFLIDYKYSSYQDYIGVNRPERLILSKKEFPRYFDRRREFADFHRDWLHYGAITKDRLRDP
ncbi:MAG: transposase [Candidatus Ryanbacteria bacterium]|nr:transposase [Candidatus Ryanbacteria bacterium]